MLKIKDNVDLKELKKYGFQLNNEEWYEIKDVEIWVAVAPISRKIEIRTNCNGVREFNGILYDLIKADLIEKVED